MTVAGSLNLMVWPVLSPEAWQVPPNLFSYSSAVNACGTSLEWQTALCVVPRQQLNQAGHRQGES